jgi:hypothetical protein
MTNLTLNRLISAVLAVATTLGLFSTVVSFAEPERSVLLAKNQPHNLSPAPVAVAMAPNSAAKEGK